MKENPNEQNQIELVNEEIKSFLVGIGLDDAFEITTKTSKSGSEMISIKGHGEVIISKGSGVEHIQHGIYSQILKSLARSFSPIKGNVGSIDLLERESYRESTLTEINIPQIKSGNEFLNSLAGKNEGSVPCFYGSTFGLNFGELLMTKTCSDLAKQSGVDSYILFDTSGNNTARAMNIFRSSSFALGNLSDEFDNYFQSLGDTFLEKRINSAKILLPDDDITYITSEEIFSKLGRKLTLGKLVVLALMAGNNPMLLGDNTRLSNITKLADGSFDDKNKLKIPVGEIPQEPNGFTFYARDAVIATDYNGTVIFPIKLTTHANIYKPLESYGSLFDQQKGSGALLAPIQRQRIQTKNQAAWGSDPVDVTVLAFLKSKYPDEFGNLINDFNNSCKVLTPEEVRAIQYTDNKFVIEDYFPIEQK